MHRKDDLAKRSVRGRPASQVLYLHDEKLLLVLKIGEYQEKRKLCRGLTAHAELFVFLVVMETPQESQQFLPVAP